MWRSKPVLTVMERVAGWALRVWKVNLTGLTSNDQLLDANPRRIWRVSASHATVKGEDLGPIGPLAEQAHMGDFYFPQHGISRLAAYLSTRARPITAALTPARRHSLREPRRDSLGRGHGDASRLATPLRPTE
jgi:hypothetical protein